MTNKPVLNLADAPVHTGSHGDNFSYALRSLASPLGANAIGANVTTGEDGQQVAAVVRGAR